ncbi:MAG: bacterial transcriptional activator domain-containing protein, partial [Ktedonobacteraceae bacterium]
ATLTPEQLRGRGTAPALTLLKLLLSRPERFALKDWITEQFCRDQELFSNVRLDNIVSQLRGLLCPSSYEDLRTHLVTHLRSSPGSGYGYQLAAYPLIWVDSDALLWNSEQAARLERFGDNPLSYWERSYQLAKRGMYLPNEAYSGWGETRRSDVAGMLRQSVQALARLCIAQHGGAGEEEALLILRSYWLENPLEEDVLRVLMELLGRRERYHEALKYYKQLCALLEAENQQPDLHTQDLAEYLRTKQTQRTSKRENPLSKQQPTGYAASHQPSIGFTLDQPQTLLLDRMEGIHNKGDQLLDSQRRKVLQQMLEVVEVTLLTPLDVLLRDLVTLGNEAKKSQVALLYEHLLALSWDHYYTTSAQHAVRYIDQWLKPLTLSAKEASGEEQTHLLTLLCHFYQLSGVAARDRMDFAQALSDGKRAIELAFHLENAELIAAALFRRAKTSLKCQHVTPAIQDVEAALSYTRRARDPLKGYVHQATAAVYALLTEQDKTFQTKSLQLFDKVARIIETGNLENDSSFVKLNIAGLSIDRAKALALFQRPGEAHRTLDIARQQLGRDITRWQARLLTVDAEIYLADNDPQQSCTLAREALRIIQCTHSLSNKQHIISLHKKLQEQFPLHSPVLLLAEELQLS